MVQHEIVVKNVFSVSIHSRSFLTWTFMLLACVFLLLDFKMHDMKVFFFFLNNHMKPFQIIFYCYCFIYASSCATVVVLYLYIRYMVLIIVLLLTAVVSSLVLV